jgi:hypothetical protein
VPNKSDVVGCCAVRTRESKSRLNLFFRSGPSTSQSSRNTTVLHTKTDANRTTAESLNKYQQRFYLRTVVDNCFL